MKILMIGTGSPAIPPTYAGTEKVIYELSRNLSILKNEIHILDTDSNYERDLSLETDNIIYKKIKFPVLYVILSGLKVNLLIRYIFKHMTWILFSVFSFFKLLYLLRKEKYDLIHTHLRYSTLTVFIATKILRNEIPIVFTVHTSTWTMKDVDLQTKLVMLPEYFAFRISSKIVALNETQKKGIIKFSGVNGNKVTVISNGVDINRFKPQTMENNNHKYINIVCVGAINGYKNQISLVKALPIINKEFKNLRLKLIGPSITDETIKIKKYCINAGINENVEITGRITLKEMIISMQEADIMVLPSLQETNPLVLLEGMSCGNAIVASDLPNLREIAQSGEILFADPNEESIAKALITILKDEKLRTHLKKLSRELVIQKYSWEKIAGNYLEVYTRIMNRRKNINHHNL